MTVAKHLFKHHSTHTHTGSRSWKTKKSNTNSTSSNILPSKLQSIQYIIKCIVLPSLVRRQTNSNRSALLGLTLCVCFSNFLLFVFAFTFRVVFSYLLEWGDVHFVIFFYQQKYQLHTYIHTYTTYRQPLCQIQDPTKGLLLTNIVLNYLEWANDYFVAFSFCFGSVKYDCLCMCVFEKKNEQHLHLLPLCQLDRYTNS